MRERAAYSVRVAVVSDTQTWSPQGPVELGEN
jgi:hypothetical protein